jgi:hypothetical protein
MRDLRFRIRLVDMDVPMERERCSDRFLARELFDRTALSAFLQETRSSYFLSQVVSSNFTPSYNIGGGVVQLNTALIIYAIFIAKVTDVNEVLLRLDEYEGVTWL